MAVEIVILTPVLVAFLLLVVAMGRWVTTKGDVESAARDAARAAAAQRTYGAAVTSAQRTVTTGVGSTADCSAVDLTNSNFVAGGTAVVRLTCKVSYSGLGMLGLPGSVTIGAEGISPIDTYRRTG